MPKIKTGYSKNFVAHGPCRIISTRGKYLIQAMDKITRFDGGGYYTFGNLMLVNKDEVSNIKEEEI